MGYGEFIVLVNWGSGIILIVDLKKWMIVRIIELDRYELKFLRIGKCVIWKYLVGDMVIVEGRFFVG